MITDTDNLFAIIDSCIRLSQAESSAFLESFSMIKDKIIIKPLYTGDTIMRKITILLLTIFSLTAVAHADSGLINVKSAHNVKETTDRLEKALNAKGMTVFIRINHAEGAQKVGKSLRPTELVIFGNPKVGTPLMQCSQSVAIDLPQKALIWEDEKGTVWYSFNDPGYLAQRHGLAGCDAVLKKVGTALNNFAAAATKP